MVKARIKLLSNAWPMKYDLFWISVFYYVKRPFNTQCLVIFWHCLDAFIFPDNVWGSQKKDNFKWDLRVERVLIDLLIEMKLARR